ncbi:MAG: argininosuccinate lyase [Granulosicoccus sp.]
MTKNNSIGSRLVEPTADEIIDTIYQPAMDTFDDISLARMCLLNEAYIVVLHQKDLITTDIAEKLLGGIQRIRAGGIESIDRNPQYEGDYFAFENTLSADLGPSVTGWIHVGRSRNDIGATLDRMKARDCCLAIMEQMNATREVMLDAANKHAHTIMPGYTHLQPAQPSTFGFLLLNVAVALQRDYERLSEAYKRINLSALGTAAFAGTSFPIDRHKIASLLGLQGIVSPGIEAVASRDFVTELLSIVVGCQTMISRVAGDFHIYTSSEFNSIRFPDRVAGTSSIMPQKKNMFVLEFLRSEAGRGIGALAGALSAIKGSNYSICLDATREGIYDAWPVLDRFATTLPLLSLVVSTAELNADELLERCRNNFSTVTDLADGLVREHSISFREAHHIAGDAVQETISTGGDATALSAEILIKAVQKEIGRDLDISGEDIHRWMDPESGVNARTTAGGVAPSEVERQIKEARQSLENDSHSLATKYSHIESAKVDLENAMKPLLES